MKQSARHMFEDIRRCRADGRQQQTAVCGFLSGLIKSRDPFPFFMLLALESGSILRAMLLLAMVPLSHLFLSEEAALQLLAFVTLSGFKLSQVELLSKVVLSRAFHQDVNPITISRFGLFGKKYVLSSLPRAMVEPFLREYVGVDEVFGSEIQVLENGYCTGLLLSCGASTRLEALKTILSKIGAGAPDVGFGDASDDLQFMTWCKEAYSIKSPAREVTSPHEFLKPMIFHDGRLATLPNPGMALTILLWAPFGVALVLLRVAVSHLPYRYRFPFSALLGVRVRVKGPLPAPSSTKRTLFVCSHKTLLDPVVLSSILQRPVTAMTYSISWLSEAFSNIKTVRLSRDRNKDKNTLKTLLQTEDVVICPEGTTCREPYLLRFSPMFAEVSDNIVPVMMYVETPLFYGTTAGGWKWLDPVFFGMNPSPSYLVEFLLPLGEEETCGKDGKSSIQVANYIQQQLAKVSGFSCTRLTRKEKYQFLLTK